MHATEDASYFSKWHYAAKRYPRSHTKQNFSSAPSPKVALRVGNPCFSKHLVGVDPDAADPSKTNPLHYVTMDVECYVCSGDVALAAKETLRFLREGETRRLGLREAAAVFVIVRTRGSERKQATERRRNKQITAVSKRTR